MASRDSSTRNSAIRVIDLVRQAGIDTRGWANFKGGPEKAAANPRYCYEWAFVNSRVVVLSLWRESFEQEGNKTVHKFTLHGLRRNHGKPIWMRRARRLHQAIQMAARDALPVRVIVCDGHMRRSGGKRTKASRVSSRFLDPVAWAVREYDWDTGDCVLARGARPIALGLADSLIKDPVKAGISSKQFAGALRTVETSLSEPQKAMLRGHYYAPGRIASMRDLALCGGYRGHRAANLLYGRMCRLIARELNFESPGDQIFVLATVQPQRDVHGHALWQMDEAVGEALQRLGWVRASMDHLTGIASPPRSPGSERETVKQCLREARLGQGRYRSGVIAIWNACSVTGCDLLDVLTASHIVPWSKSTNRERLDPNNGLLLTPNMDRLFDAHLITFLKDGRLKVTKALTAQAARVLGVTGKERLRSTPTAVLPYLRRHHREFERKERMRF
jgi:hypothetical protein